MPKIPSDQHITYQFQYRKCGKTSCSTCRNGQGHGPYWYAYWREGSRLRSGYVGKIHPSLRQATPHISPPSPEVKDTAANIILEDFAATPAVPVN
jgi:hypothetical protein